MVRGVAGLLLGLPAVQGRLGQQPYGGAVPYGYAQPYYNGMAPGYAGAMPNTYNNMPMPAGPIAPAAAAQPAQMKALPSSVKPIKSKPIESYLHSLIKEGDNTVKNQIKTVAQQATGAIVKPQAVQLAQRAGQLAQGAFLAELGIAKAAKSVINTVKSIKESQDPEQKMKDMVNHTLSKVLTSKAGDTLVGMAMPVIVSNALGSVPPGERLVKSAGATFGYTMSKLAQAFAQAHPENEGENKDVAASSLEEEALVDEGLPVAEDKKMTASSMLR